LALRAKVKGNRWASVLLLVAVLYVLYEDSLLMHSAYDHVASVKATHPRRGNLPPLGTTHSFGGASKIANSELLTAGNPTV